MAARVVRLGSVRTEDEGVRIGTVRRPPRGVPKSEFAKRDFYDTWLPVLSPSPATVKIGLAAESPAQWAKFVKRYRAEMAKPEADHVLELLARLSHDTSFAVGCYCEDEDRCHRSVLRRLLIEKGAKVE